MKNATQLLKNTLMLATSNIVLRLLSLCFQAFLAAKIGAGELGLFGIVSSVGVVFATVAISGVRFGVTRLAAKQYSIGNKYPRKLMRTAFVYGAFFGLVSFSVLFFAAEFFSGHWVMNQSATRPLRIMALSMPFISLGAVAEGYFTAKQKVFRLVGAELFAQIVRVAFVWLFLQSPGDLFSSSAEILASGALTGEVVLSVSLFALYAFEVRGKKDCISAENSGMELVKTSLPLAVSAYMRTGLSSLGQVIIPRGLRKSGMNTKTAFSTYGVITQMAFPVVMFPAALLGALGEVLVPRLTGAQENGHRISISYIVNRALRIGVIFSLGVMGGMLFFAEKLGDCLYSSKEAGNYIKLFAPLLPVIYIDCVTDGCLKGLGQQVHSMVYNVLEGILNVTLLFFLLPAMSIKGYVIVMYIKEIFNAVLSFRRLCKVSCVERNISVVLCALTAVILSRLFLGIVMPQSGLWSGLAVYLCFYLVLLYVLNAVTRDDLRWVVSLIKPDNCTNFEEKTKKPVRGVDKRLSHW